MDNTFWGLLKVLFFILFFWLKLLIALAAEGKLPLLQPTGVWWGRLARHCFFFLFHFVFYPLCVFSTVCHFLFIYRLLKANCLYCNLLEFDGVVLLDNTKGWMVGSPMEEKLLMAENLKEKLKRLKERLKETSLKTMTTIVQRWENLGGQQNERFGKPTPELVVGYCLYYSLQESAGIFVLLSEFCRHFYDCA